MRFTEMKTNNKLRNIIKIILTVLTLVCCLSLLCGCHIFAWYIPKPYSDKEEAEIYEFIRQNLLTDLPQYIATVYIDNADGSDGAKDYNIFYGEDEVIINSSTYANEGLADYSIWYDGMLKTWDKKTRTETVTQVDISEYRFLFDAIEDCAEFVKNKVVNVASYRDGSYFWECFPWGIGMAQMYYDDVDGVSVTGFWQVEKKSAVRHEGLPLVYNAEFNCGNERGFVHLDVYGSPYGIQERITNILAGYEEYKERLPMIEDVKVYLTINNEKLSLLLYDNEAARALIERLQQGNITCTVDDYGNFEKAGSLGFSLPRDDEPITTGVGDVMLYQGNQIVLFYGENTWNYTRLGHIVGYSSELITGILRDTNGATEITLSLN